MSNPMNLTIPVVSTTTGPEYASEVNDDLETIASHDHTDGQGVQVPSAGIGIDADLPFNNFSATDLATAVLKDQTVPANASGYIICQNGDLYWFNPASSTLVQLTSGGSVVGAVGNWTGLTTPAEADSTPQTSVGAADGFFSLYQNKAQNQFATLAAGPIILRSTNSGASDSVTIKVPAGLGGTYALTLPAIVPATTLPVQMSAAGALTAAQLVTAQYSDASVTRAKQAPVGQTTAAVGSAFVNTTSPQTVATITGFVSTGRPIIVGAMATPGAQSVCSMSNNGSVATDAAIRIVVTGSASATLSSSDLGGLDTARAGQTVKYSPTIWSAMYAATSGTYNFSFQASVSNVLTTFQISNVTFYAYEL